MGWTDSFDAGVEPAWTFNGTWGIQPGAGVDGSAALTDSPGDYANSSDTWAQTAVDLSSAHADLSLRIASAAAEWGQRYVQIGAADNENIARSMDHGLHVREARSAWRNSMRPLSQEGASHGLHPVPSRHGRRRCG
jgi:hypothetical protein